MQQRVSTFLNSDLESQAGQISNAMAQSNMEQQPA